MKHARHIPESIRKFVWDDFWNVSLAYEPEPCNLPETIAYWDEMMQEARSADRRILRSLTPELYVTVWNEYCEERKVKS